MIFKVAWRNIWRSKVRSIIVLSSIAIGIWAGVLIIGFAFGMNNERTAAAIESTLGHAQIHPTEFLADPNAQYTLDSAALDTITAVLTANPHITGWTSRGIYQGMVAAPKSARAARILAINPATEADLTTLDEILVEGEYFGDRGRNPIILGQKLADKLGVGLKKKVVLTFQDSRGELVRASFRIVGIYKSLNAQWDEFNLYIRSSDLANQTNTTDIHELVLFYDQTSETEAITAELDPQMPAGTTLLSWKKNSPELGYADDMMGIMLVLVLGIIMMALMFGIVNNMLMAILERRRELGMLMAVGMNKRKVFLMILLETLLLGLIGGPIGILLGDVSVRIMMNIGVDLSSKAEGLAELGVQSVIYPEIVPEYYLITAIMVLITALIASIPPAIRALKLNPTQAIRGN